MSTENIVTVKRGAPPLSERADGRLSALGTVAGFGAVLAAASCCVLPLALAAFGAGAGFSSTFAALIPLRWPLTLLSLFGLAAGWWTYLRRRKACAVDQSCTLPMPSRSTSVMLVAGSALTLVALAWDWMEAPLMNAVS